MGTYIENGTFTSDPATANFADAFLTPAGTWTGSLGDIFNVHGSLTWTGGAMSGTGGVTNAQGTSTISGDANKTLSGWTLNNQTPATIGGSDNVVLGNGAVLNNTSTIDVQSDA